jgi:hypothetical protein
MRERSCRTLSAMGVLVVVEIIGIRVYDIAPRAATDQITAFRV